MAEYTELIIAQTSCLLSLWKGATYKYYILELINSLTLFQYSYYYIPIIITKYNVHHWKTRGNPDVIDYQ